MAERPEEKAVKRYTEIARLSLPGKWSTVGWIAPNGLSFDEWCTYSDAFSVMTSAIHLWIGDWLNHGENKWGEIYAQAMDETQFSYDVLSRNKYVTSRVPIWIRNQKLTFSHYLAVAPLPTVEDREKWLALAAQGESGARWSVRKLKEKMNAPSIETAAEVQDTPEYDNRVTLNNEAPSLFSDNGSVCPRCGYRWQK